MSWLPLGNFIILNTFVLTRTLILLASSLAMTALPLWRRRADCWAIMFLLCWEFSLDIIDNFCSRKSTLLELASPSNNDGREGVDE